MKSYKVGPVRLASQSVFYFQLVDRYQRVLGFKRDDYFVFNDQPASLNPSHCF